jgi:DNA modification methylase
MDAIIHQGDCRETLKRLAAEGVRVNTCVTSPPYFGLRSYLAEGHDDKGLEIGAEQSPKEYIENMVEVFRAVRDVLADDGSLWLNLGDSYSGAAGKAWAAKRPKLYRRASKAKDRPGPQA